MLDRLEAALERERDFVADAGHELRTPLALLRTELELAARQARSEDDLRAAVSSASREAERLSRLAEDLLLIARSDRGQLPLRVEDVDVDELLGAVASRFAWRAPVQRRTTGGLGIRGDRLRLEQALANLVDNALRYGDGAVERMTVGSSSTSGTRGAAFRRSSSTARSSGSLARIRRGRPEEPGSASRSCGRSPRLTEAARARPTVPPTGPTSGSRFLLVVAAGRTVLADRPPAEGDLERLPFAVADYRDRDPVARLMVP